MASGIPDSPGRAKAVQKAVSKSEWKKLAKQSSKGKSRIGLPVINAGKQALHQKVQTI